ncbi:TIGR00645 family protein [Cnuibacter sp. UC19_7]|uniref:TIGR00645 family protein n=1 Tax=Cnuibacter sp. UC19_7 TaxID=3350166 RepID=UPI00366E2F87
MSQDDRNAAQNSTSEPSAAKPGGSDGRVYRDSTTARTLGLFIFASRWLQAPLYFGLIVAQIIYVIVFMVDLWHIVEENVLHNWAYIDETQIMLAVLGLIDVVMIANLLIMVIIGGYETFVSKIRVTGHPDEPEWLSHVNTNLLKVKLAVSIISISSIHLLRTFIEVGDIGAPDQESDTGHTYTEAGVLWQVVIHLSFVVSAIALALIDRWSHHFAVKRKADAVEPTPAPAPAPAAPAGIPVGVGVSTATTSTGAALVSATPVTGYIVDGRFIPSA